MKLSVMILNGLGGKQYSSQHAIHSAEAINSIQPEYLSTLVLSYPYGLKHFKSRFKGEFLPLEPLDLIRELRQFMELLDLKSTVFRSDHASNYLVLKGNLNRDKEELLKMMDSVIESNDSNGLRPEWMRGL